jgi:hypothetical protein
MMMMMMMMMRMRMMMMVMWIKKMRMMILSPPRVPAADNTFPPALNSPDLIISPTGLREKRARQRKAEAKQAREEADRLRRPSSDNPSPLRPLHQTLPLTPEP